MCVHLNKEKQSRDDDTNNKGQETTKTNKLSCGSIDSVHASSVDVLVSFHMLQVIVHVVVLVAVLRVTNSIVVNAPNLFTFRPVREFLVEIHTAKMDL